jgi:hypothetical protein
MEEKVWKCRIFDGSENDGRCVRVKLDTDPNEPKSFEVVVKDVLISALQRDLERLTRENSDLRRALKHERQQKSGKCNFTEQKGKK